MNHSPESKRESSIPRREFIKRAGAGAAGLTLCLGPEGSAQAASEKKIPVGLQLWSVREQCKTDLP